MSTTVLADRDIVADFVAVLAQHRHVHSAEPLGDGRWKVRRRCATSAEILTSEQTEELVMDHLIAAFAARGLASSYDF
ncbi:MULTISPECIES: hypothetical protein [unclassified Kitasatospora]|uniref:hypothetical protein n=1 Tax=unclassified Kitasatospora TaxID=2633591 RepID=UPI00070A0DC3|nr:MULTISPECIES: hypothetical protein [unclassified Kitasatospora]KQV20897.1 hypothetical protein ASC99_20545 [Kitasatospora sp. Root107]KRB60450.1 hypothetical protein ASE03_12635 [Kitasatospora sp. Root187]